MECPVFTGTLESKKPLDMDIKWGKKKWHVTFSFTLS